VQTSTGAALTLFFVNTAAAEQGCLANIRPKSFKESFLMPAEIPANLNPGTPCFDGKRFMISIVCLSTFA
jgi:hypothetical protein